MRMREKTLISTCACSPQEALRYFNQTTMQLQMLEFSQQHLLSDDEVSVKLELARLTDSNESSQAHLKDSMAHHTLQCIKRPAGGSTSPAAASCVVTQRSEGRASINRD